MNFFLGSSLFFRFDFNFFFCGLLDFFKKNFLKYDDYYFDIFLLFLIV